MDIIITILALGLLVFIHELGHFFIARYFGVKIETFSIGIGPKIFKYEYSGTVYAISAIPLGGYCKMKGEHAEEGQEPEIDSFFAKEWWQRLMIVLAGPFFNLILAWILIMLSFYIGHAYSDLSPVIYTAQSPYDQVFVEGDKILGVNSQSVQSYTDIFKNIK
ncbi:MAG: RIP metalloprotease RseP, partial [Candidatus Cloacimonetes bacterium]|nr:RIP metalloprotease RseP [Candidatus Cloacimonadota bacterium]